ncbi:MAG: AraC family transcriptional regulator [Candidatus Kapabacteria bacterium]|jgi:AraC-like DNA-binding protein|nr:AraC family transcriptional regulator [Candidatus Kapabacteria bacterium]
MNTELFHHSGVSYRPQVQHLTAYQNLQTTVENRTIYSMNHCELNIFETHQQSSNVRLQFGHLTFTAMLRGKKVMHLHKGKNRFEYLPGESVVLPDNEEMVIDFPEASPENPTQCIALVIEKQKVEETLDMLNERHTKVETHDRWMLDTAQFHLQNSQAMTHTIDRLMFISKEQHSAKDVLANFALQELLIRLMQTQARTLILGNHRQYLTSHRFAAVVEYIQQHITEPISVEQLSRIAYMSQPHFFRCFKQEFGISPTEFLIQERLRLAKEFLRNPRISVMDACFKAGFNSVNYFCSTFKKHEGLSPKAYQLKLRLGV